jgi:hypothetical protein
MRQQLLAHEMEKARRTWLGCGQPTHIAPATIGFQNDYIALLKTPGLPESATEVWKSLVTTTGLHQLVGTETLFGHLDPERFPELKDLAKYIQARYTWIAS